MPLVDNTRRIVRYPALAIRDPKTLNAGVDLVPGRPGWLKRRRAPEWLRFPSQVEFDELDVKFKGYSGPIGSGKSAALVREAIKLSYLNPGCRGLIGAPTYKLLSDSTTVELLTTLDEFEIPHHYMPGSSRIFMEEPRSLILLRTLDEPERLRAMNLAWFGIDELSYCKEAAWSRLEGRLRDPNAKVKRGFAVWTPKGKDWVYRQWISARKVPHYHCVRAKPFENRAILDSTPDFYENLKHSYDEKFYKQEVLGEYIDMFAGAVYHAFSSDDNVRETNYNANKPLVVSMDFNVDPMSGVVCQADTLFGQTTVNVLKEIVLPGSNTESWIRELVRRLKPWSDVAAQDHRQIEISFYGDAAGGQRKTSASDGATDWSIVRNFMYKLPQFRCTFRQKASNPEIKDRINAVNAMLCAFGISRHVAGQRRLFVHPECRELLLDLEDVKWKVDAAGNSYPELDKKDNKRTHISDALGYYVETEFGIGGNDRVRFSKETW